MRGEHPVNKRITSRVWYGMLRSPGKVVEAKMHRHFSQPLYGDLFNARFYGWTADAFYSIRAQIEDEFYHEAWGIWRVK